MWPVVKIVSPMRMCAERSPSLWVSFTVPRIAVRGATTTKIKSAALGALFFSTRQSCDDLRQTPQMRHRPSTQMKRRFFICSRFIGGISMLSLQICGRVTNTMRTSEYRLAGDERMIQPGVPDPIFFLHFTQGGLRVGTDAAPRPASIFPRGGKG